MIRVHLDQRWHVDLRAAFSVDMSADAAWEHLRDFKRFAAVDLFHHHVDVAGDQAVPGAALRIKHRFACFSVTRIGRILNWRHGRSYAFSDLSARGPGVGFPHVYQYTLVPQGPRRCRVRIKISGRWTAHFIPRQLVRLWLWWIMGKIRLSIENELLRSQIGQSLGGYRAGRCENAIQGRDQPHERNKTRMSAPEGRTYSTE